MLGLLSLTTGCIWRDKPLLLSPTRSDAFQNLAALWNDIGPDSVQYIDSAGAQGGSLINARELLAHRLDLALIQNDTRIVLTQDSSLPQRGDKRIRSVWPINTLVLIIVCRADNPARTLEQLVKGKQIGIPTVGSGAPQLITALLMHFGISPASYNIRRCAYEQLLPSDSVDVAFSLRLISEAYVRNLASDPRFRIFSLDIPRYGEESSFVDGFCLNYPFARPYFLPRGTLGIAQTEPTLTVAVDVVLICRASQDPEQVARLVATLVEHRSQLVSENPVFQDLPTSLEGRTLQYPLHEGVHQYLERDKPTFFERYAETIGLVITLLSLGYAGLVTVTQTRKRRRKNRIDTYYTIVMDLEQRAPELATLAEVHTEQRRLLAVRHKALHELADERLDADASFVILLDLVRSAQVGLEARAVQLSVSGAPAPPA